MGKVSPFRLALVALFMALATTGCSNFFGDKTDTAFITPPQPDNRTVAYVAIQPAFGGFRMPVDVIAGNDQLFYVVDANEADPSQNQIVCLNEAGVRLASLRINGATAVAQDRRLDLWVCGRIDTLAANGERVNVPAIYRLNLKTRTPYGLANAVFTDTIVQPFYFTRNRGIVGRLDVPVQFNDIAVLPDNRLLVTRTGPNKDLITNVPDDAVLLFQPDGRFQTTINISGEGGASYSDFFRRPFGIATVPPQRDVVDPNELQDFIVTTQDLSADTALRVKYIQTQADDNGVSYQVKGLPIPTDTSVKGYLYQNGKFRRPYGVAIANDQTGFIFITDKDSLFQFTPEGVEGVRLAASSIRKGYNKTSFGGTGSGPYKFNQPRAVAYSNRYVYVADSRNGEIKRFRLSTDFE